VSSGFSETKSELGGNLPRYHLYGMIKIIDAAHTRQEKVTIRQSAFDNDHELYLIPIYHATTTCRPRLASNLPSVQH
jgi:hypothetical protein